MIQSVEPSEPQIVDRRLFLRAAVVAIPAGIILDACSFDRPPQAETPEHIDDPFCQSAETEKSPEDDTSYPAVFADRRAEAVANALFITPGSYFVLNPEAIKAVNDAGDFRDKTWLAPIFPPAVMEHEEAIIAAAEEFGVPSNVLASLATIESAGNTGASSGADAHGIIQVVPRFHRDRIDRLSGERFTSDEERSQFLREHPEQCIRIGAEYFAECVQSAQQGMPNLRQDSMVIYARAAAAYNGGPARAGQDFDQLRLESKLYVNHVARLTLDVAIAAKLRDQGLDDDEILRAMQSKEINARAVAYDGFDRGEDFALYEESARLCASPQPGVNIESGEVDSQQVFDAYTAYMNDCADVNEYQVPATPGLRIWLVGGGDRLFLSIPKNAAWRLPE